jgi:hypothetical protein
VDHQLIAPALALLGTALVAAVGFYQWRKQNANPNRAANAAARRDAYEGLWKRLEEINLELRNKGSHSPLRTHQHSINEYFIRHSLYFEEPDQVVIEQYIHALHRLRSAVDKAGRADVREHYEDTGAFPMSDIAPLLTAVEEIERYRNIIKAKVQKVAGSV